MTFKRLIAGVLSVVLLALSGCSKNYFDINSNPNQVTAASPVLVLPAAQTTSGAYFSTEFPFLNLWMGYWNWSGNYSITLSDRNYQFTNNYYNGIWNDSYTNLKNYTYIDTQAGVLGQPYLQGIAKIMKSLHFQYLVDTYGNIPYTQALQGVTTPTPTYDNQIAVYEDLFKQIDAGLALLDQGKQQEAQGANVLNPGSSDIIFGGDMNKWRRFANTLKLRMLLRQSERADRQTFIQAQLAIIKNSGFGFLLSGENASVNPGYVNSTNQQNPFYATFGFSVTGAPAELNNEYKGNKFAIDFYKNTNDPRLGAYYYPVGGTGTTFTATNFGDLANAQPNSAVSAIGPALLQGATQSAVILSSHEAFFEQAEAAQRGWIVGDPKGLYQQAITESFMNVGLTAAQATTYYSQAVNDVGWDASTNKIEAIITQKWASLNGFSPYESWSDYRRLGIPAVPISLSATNIKQVPIRLFYPQSEYLYNSTNVGAQGTISQFTTKVFWIK